MNRFHAGHTGLALLATTMATTVQAIEVLNSEWKGTGELGYVATSGNTETQSLKAKLGLTHERPEWRHTLGLEALNSSEAENTTAERYAGNWQSDYKFTQRDYVFGRLSYETDKFSGYEYRTSEILGYGRRVLEQPDMTLDLEAGAGARQSRLETGGIENEPILRLAGKYAWKISPNAKFTQDVASDIGSDSTITRAVTALQADIIGNLAMKLSYTVEHTSQVPVGVKKTDTETAASLVYSF